MDTFVAPIVSVVDRRKGYLPFWCHAVHTDEKSECFLSGGKVAKWLLASVYRLFDHPRPPPVSRQFVHRSVAVWEFHRFHFLSILECRRLKNA